MSRNPPPSLRPGANGGDGHANGLHDDDAARRYDGAYTAGPGAPRASSRERRPGGYGGFQDGPTHQPDYQQSQLQQPPRAIEPGSPSANRRMWGGPEEGRWKNKSRSRERTGANGTAGYGEGQGSRQIEG
ncbi:MAG: hypothetical protein M1819_007116 [Sarea resinae]|nr:MAG: hypothetical protein M1819_007116 [Sarea resinae]